MKKFFNNPGVQVAIFIVSIWLIVPWLARYFIWVLQ